MMICECGCKKVSHDAFGCCVCGSRGCSQFRVELRLSEMTDRCLNFLDRCRLAERFTSPTMPARPPFSAAEIKGWFDEGLVEWRNGCRLTPAGRAALEGSGKMTKLAGER
jgi:hypothetical protein